MRLNLRTEESRKLLDDRIANKAVIVARLEAAGYKPNELEAAKERSTDEAAKFARQRDENLQRVMDGDTSIILSHIESWSKKGHKFVIRMRSTENHQWVCSHFVGRQKKARRMSIAEGLETIR